MNLRDHMSEAELIFTALAKLSTRRIAETMEATGMEENKVAGKTGGELALREPKEILEEMKILDDESAEILNNIKKFL